MNKPFFSGWRSRAKTAPLQDYYENSGAVILIYGNKRCLLTAQEVNQQIMDAEAKPGIAGEVMKTSVYAIGDLHLSGAG